MPKAPPRQTIIREFAGKSCQADAKNDDDDTCDTPDHLPSDGRHTPKDRGVLAADAVPKIPDHRKVNQDGDPLQPRDPDAMVRQECHLPLQQNEHWTAHESYPGNKPQGQAAETRALFCRSSEKLQHQKRIQSLPQELTVNRDRDCLSQHGVVILRLSGQREQLKKNVEVENHQNRGSDQEETDEGQVYVEQRQFDRVFEKQIPVRHRSEGDHEVKLEGYEGCPENGGLTRRVVQRSLQLVHVFRIDGHHRSFALATGALMTVTLPLVVGGVEGSAVPASRLM